MAIDSGTRESWVDTALADFTAARRGGGAAHVERGGVEWRYETAWFWSERLNRRAPAAGLLGLCWLVGVGLLIWALVGMRSAPLQPWRAIAGGALILLGSVAITAWRRATFMPPRDGLLIAAKGLIDLHGGETCSIARPDVDDVTIRDGEIVVSSCRGEATIVARRNADAEHLADARDALSAWRQSGALPEPSGRPLMKRELPSLVRSPLGWLVGAGVIGGFCYLTLVMPGRSESGRAARAFVAAVGRGDAARVRELLHPRTADRLGADPLSELPARVRAARRLSVNGFYSVDSWGGDTISCIDGWLEPSGKYFAVSVYHSRIARWYVGGCNHETWWLKRP